MPSALSKQEQLDLAISVAVDAHCSKSVLGLNGKRSFKKGQFDKIGKPYILHPIRLATQLLHDTQLATIAVLHDVVEDSSYTIEDFIDMGFSQRVIVALRLLTHDKKDDYLTVYIPGICGNYDAVRVKRKDIGHNSDITRLKGLTEKDIARTIKYQKAFTILGQAKKNFENRR